jgi:hypothetical protein
VTDAESAWDWLTDTYWYVPEENLLAFIARPAAQQVVPVTDQTVFYIRESRSGYFWGSATVQLGGQQPVCYFLSGSVDPVGNVLLTFTPAADISTDTVVTHGSGVMCLRDGAPAMLNQMSSGPATVQVSHWAYMLQTSEGEPSWNSLPGVGVSVPDFIAPCTGNPDS